MKILKSENFQTHQALTQFVNDNNIIREDIVSIINPSSVLECILFFYADSEIIEKTRNIWGKLKD